MNMNACQVNPDVISSKWVSGSFVINFEKAKICFTIPQIFDIA